MAQKSSNSVALYDPLIGEESSIASLRDQFIRYGSEVLCLSSDTMKTRKSHLKYLVEFCERNEINTRNLSNPVLDEFFIQHGRRRSKNTVNTARRIVKVFIRWLIEYKELPVRVNPEAIRLVRVRDKAPKAIDDLKITQAIRMAEEEQDALMIATFRESGIRIKEIVELRVEDIIGTQLRIWGKGDVDRVVNITGQLSLRLRKFAQDNNRESHDHLFQNTWRGTGGKMSIGTVRVRVQRCFMDYVGIEMTPHQLRHSMAVGLLRDGCDLVTIQTQLGHKDIQTTMVYLRIENSFFKESYARSMKKSFLAY